MAQQPPWEFRYDQANKFIDKGIKKAGPNATPRQKFRAAKEEFSKVYSDPGEGMMESGMATTGMSRRDMRRHFKERIEARSQPEPPMPKTRPLPKVRPRGRSKASGR